MSTIKRLLRVEIVGVVYLCVSVLDRHTMYMHFTLLVSLFRYMYSCCGIVIIFLHVAMFRLTMPGMKQELDRDGGGPDRNSADFRIRKAQVS